MKVLLCDDSRTIRLVLGRIVRELGGTEIREAADGREAIKAVEEEQFDLILLDINMPELDGLSTLEMIKAPDSAHADTPVVIVSSDSDYRQVERAQELGAFGYVKKPFKAEGLATAFKQAAEAEARRAGSINVGQHGPGKSQPRAGPPAISVR